MRKKLCVIATLLLFGSLVFAIVGCKRKEEAAPEALKGTITLYTSVPQPIADKIQTDF